MRHLWRPFLYKNSKAVFLYGLLVWLGAVSAFANEHSEPQCRNTHSAVVVGTASHPESNTLLYCEYHILQQGNLGVDTRALVVRYFDASGEEIANKSVVYGSNPVQPEINQQDFRTGELRMAKRNAGGRWVMTYQESQRDKIKTEQAALSDQGVVDSGFNQFIILHWDKLQSGAPLVVEFLSIPHLKTIKLQVRRVECERDSKGEQVCFDIQINNAFLRLITGELYLEYSPAKQLMLFRGVVNIRNDNEKTQKAVVKYRYFE